MEFIETKIFTKIMKHYFSDDEFAEFQNFLAAKPDCGDIIKGSGGLRKIRGATWSPP